MNQQIKLKKRGLVLGIAALICCLLIPATVFAADIDVYAEGTYTSTEMVLDIYANINTGSILSFGVKVNYPTELTYSNATKNEAVWFFGDGTTNHPYMNPENDGSGVLIIGGKLDTTDPTAGVNGTRVLLGTVSFTHNGVTDFSGVTLSYGRGDGSGSYKNFVATDGTVFDGTSGGVGFTCCNLTAGVPDTDGDGVLDDIDNCTLIANADQRDSNSDGYGNRCDADLDNSGLTNFADFGKFQIQYLSVGPDADFNGDGVVNFSDFGIFQTLYLKQPGPSGLVP